MRNMSYFIACLFLLLLTSCNNDDDIAQDDNLEGQGQSLLAFYVFGELDCGEISIAVTGLETKTMDGQERPMGFVDCQDTSPSVVQWNDIPSGTYNYTATCQGFTWTGTRSLGNGTCSYLALTAGSAD